jgi:hypothetical protein
MVDGKSELGWDGEMRDGGWMMWRDGGLGGRVGGNGDGG